MAGGIALPTALKLIGGVPLLKVGTVFAEKLSITKRLDGGATGDLMKKVIQDGNLSSIMQNPMGALTGALQGQLAGALGQLSGLSNVGGLVSAISGASGLGSALSAFQAAGDNLAGLTNGGAGFMAMIGHDVTAGMVGDAMPAAALTSVVTGPLTSGDLLSTVANTLPQVIGQVANGTLDAVSAAAWVSGISGQLNGIVSASANALAWSDANHTIIAAAATIGGALAVPPVFDADGYRSEGAPTGFQGVLRSLVQPAVAGALGDALAALTAATKHDPAQPDLFTSLGE